MSSPHGPTEQLNKHSSSLLCILALSLLDLLSPVSVTIHPRFYIPWMHDFRYNERRKWASIYDISNPRKLPIIQSALIGYW